MREMGQTFNGRVTPLFVALLATALLATPLRAGNPLWVAQASGFQSNGFDAAVDHAGNVYVTGSFRGDVSFTHATMENPGRGTGTDVLVASYAPDGRLRWAKQEGGAGPDAGLHIAAGRSGVYVTGYYKGSAEFGGHRLPAAPGRSLFVAKYDFDGKLLWARAAGDAGVMGPEGIALDAEDNCHVLGYFKEYADFGQTRLEKAMAKNLFLVRYSANGDLVWARPITGGNSFTTGPWARGVAAVPDGTILVTGHTRGENRINETRFATASTRYGSQLLPNQEIFVARFSPAGQVLTVKSVASFADVEDIACDASGNVFLAGGFKGAASGPKAGTARFVNAELAATPNDGGRHDNADIFLAKYDRELNLAWVRSASGSGDDKALAVAVDHAGNASITGLFYGTARFGERTLTVTGGDPLKADVFLATYSGTGDLLSLDQGGGEGLDRGDGIAVGRDGARTVTGFFNGPAPRFGNQRLEPGRSSLLFVARYPAVASSRPPGPDDATGAGAGAQKPTRIVEASSAVPVFLGFTERAAENGMGRYRVPVRITSIEEYERLFGGPERTRYRILEISATSGEDFTVDQRRFLIRPENAGRRAILHQSLRLYFQNGGGPCYILSVDNYQRSRYPTASDPERFTAALAAIASLAEPTLLVAPDAAAMASEADLAAIATAMLDEAARSRHRFAIIDLAPPATVDGWLAPDMLARFRSRIDQNHAAHGAAYHPWIRTTLISADEIDYTRFDSREELAAVLVASLDAGDPTRAEKMALLEELPRAGRDANLDARLGGAFPLYVELKRIILDRENLMPPSTAVAAVYVATDAEEGPWRAPANRAIVGAVSTAIPMSEATVAALAGGASENGSINPLRVVAGRGLLPWGARTLAGNPTSDRFVASARTLRLIERAIDGGLAFTANRPNNAELWRATRELIEAYLLNKWRAGALKGATRAQAYQVSVGRGETMTDRDIAEGRLVVEIGLALFKPAEFTRLRFVRSVDSR